MLRDSHPHSRVRAVGNHRLYIGGMETNFFIEYSIVIALQCFPIGQRLLPRFTRRSMLASFQIFERHFVGGHHTSPRSHLDGEIAKRKPALHRQPPDSRTCIFHKITGGAACRHFRHHVESKILSRYPFAQFTVYGDAHRFRARLQYTLGSQNHFHLTRADAESDRPQSAVSGRMRISANDRHARQSQSTLRTHHMDDSVLRVHHPVMSQAEFFGILLQRIHLSPRNRVFNRLVLIVCRSVMVGHAEHFFGTQHFQPPCTKPCKRLRAGHFVAIQPINIKLRRTVLDRSHHVRIPYFVK